MTGAAQERADRVAGEEASVAPLEDRAGFLAEWSALYARQNTPGARASFFLSPAWMRALLGCAPVSAPLLRVRIDSEGAPALLGLIGKPAEPLSRALRVPRLVLNETGVERLDTVYIEDNDFLLAPDAPPALRGAALAAIRRQYPDRDLVLRNAAPALVEAARNQPEAGAPLQMVRSQPVFTIDLDALRTLGGGLLDQRSKSLRAKVNRSRRRYEERGAISIRAVRPGERWDEAWARLGALHEDGWRRRGTAGAFSNPVFNDFHRRLVATPPDCAEILELVVGDDVIGSLYNFLHQGRALNYQSGFRYENDNQLTPGLLAHTLAAEHYRDRGFAIYDLLAGEQDYKRRLAEEAGRVETLVMEPRRGVRARFRAVYRRLKRARAGR